MIGPGRPRGTRPRGAACDAELWAAAQAGSSESLGKLFDRYADVIYRYALVRLRRAEWAEDVVAMVFSEAWRQRHNIDLLDGSLRPWLLGVARNQANQILRQQSRRDRLEQRSPAEAHGDHAEAVAVGADAARDLVTVLAAIERLPEQPRETLVLHVWGQLTHEQIAGELNISVGTVKSRLHRARTRLATALHQSPQTVLVPSGRVEVLAPADREADT